MKVYSCNLRQELSCGLSISTRKIVQSSFFNSFWELLLPTSYIDAKKVSLLTSNVLFRSCNLDPDKRMQISTFSSIVRTDITVRVI